jgi:recombination protein RecT
MNSKSQNRQLSNRLNNQQGADLRPDKIFEDSMRSWWGGNGKKIIELCGSAEVARKLFITAIGVVQKTPKLIECNFNSFIHCLLTSAELGLFPGAKQECAYVPFGDTATFLPQYQGVVKLCMNSGFLKNIRAVVVWEGEHFKYQEGVDLVLEHVPDMDIDHMTAKRVCVYAIVKTIFDEVQVVVLSPKFIERTKSRSKGTQKPESPWNSKIPEDVDWMWKKTAIKQVLKPFPKSEKLARMIDIDNGYERPDLSKQPILDLSSLTAMVSDNKPAALPESTGQTMSVPQNNEPETVPVGQGTQTAEQRALYGEQK